MFETEIDFIKKLYSRDRISLHEPVFVGNEKKYVVDCLETTFVSTVGEYVNRFEQSICEYTGSKFSIATTNGTSALHLSLVALGVKSGDEVITQNITFIATVNAISYCMAIPVLVDCDEDNLGLSPRSLEEFLDQTAELKDGICFNSKTGRPIRACIPMHVFGHPAKIIEIIAICKKWNVKVIEDAAESLGSFYKGQHTGTFGDVGTLSFNGNKIVTCGGGGMVITNDPETAKHLKHLSTTARVPHKWEFLHDEVGYNYRLPNINAALGVAQMEKLTGFIKNKRETASLYEQFFNERGVSFLKEAPNCVSNYWLNAIILEDRRSRDKFLESTNNASVMTRPLWTLISDLSIYKHALKTSQTNSEFFRDRLVNLPSGVRK